MSEPKQDVLAVIAGTDFDETYYIHDAETGTFVDWTDGTWHVEAEMRDRKGRLVARIANFGTRDGEVTLATEGRLKLNLPAAFTAEMPITHDYTNSTDPRVVTWRHRGTLFFALTATETVSSDVSGLVQGTMTVTRGNS